jgi:phosphonate transport system substrate-binding protein
MMLKSYAKGFTALALGLAALSFTACSKKTEAPSGAPVTEITFAVLAVEKSQKLDKLWAPIFADMEKQTGLKVKPFYSSNYSGLIEAMRFNQVQAGFFSSATGLEVINRANGEVFAHNTNPDGTDSYNSVIIVRADSKLTLDDVLKCDHKLNFGMGDVKSTSGTIAPKAFLFLPHHIDTNNCFKSVKSGSHGANIEGVIAGVVDAATGNSDALKELNDTPEGKEKRAKLKVIWESDPMPKGVIEYRSDLDPAAKEKLRSFFLSYGTGTGPEAERQRANLAAFQWGPMLPSDSSYLLPERLMEARVALSEATLAGKTEDAAKAQAEIDQVTKALAALAAKSAPQAPADRPSSIAAQ